MCSGKGIGLLCGCNEAPKLVLKEALCVDAAEEGGRDTSETLPLDELVRKRVRDPPL